MRQPFEYCCHVDADHALAVAILLSGRSRDVVGVVRRAEDRGVLRGRLV
jgi:hypothetical protein